MLCEHLLGDPQRERCEFECEPEEQSHHEDNKPSEYLSVLLQFTCYILR